MYDVAKILQPLFLDAKQYLSIVNQLAPSNNYKRYLDEYAKGNHIDFIGNNMSKYVFGGKLFVRYVLH